MYPEIMVLPHLREELTRGQSKGKYETAHALEAVDSGLGKAAGYKHGGT